MKIIIAGLIAAGAIVAVTPLDAETAAPNPARAMVTDQLSQTLNRKQIAVLNLIAHATAASIVCGSIDLNEEAVKGALTTVINEDLPDLPTPDARDTFRDRTLIGFGAIVGQMIDEAAPKQGAFCKLAEQEMHEEGVKSFLKPHLSTNR